MTARDETQVWMDKFLKEHTLTTATRYDSSIVDADRRFAKYVKRVQENIADVIYTGYREALFICQEKDDPMAPMMAAAVECHSPEIPWDWPRTFWGTP